VVETIHGTVLPGTVTPVLTPDQLKMLSTARARAALRGVVVHCMPDDTGSPEYVVTQGPWTVALKSLDELEAWLDRIEGRRRPDAAGAST
jgi:hypothetical protein